jgi:hypothetical protein
MIKKYKPANLALLFYFLFSYILPPIISWSLNYKSITYIDFDLQKNTTLYQILLYIPVIVFIFLPANFSNSFNRNYTLSVQFPEKTISALLIIFFFLAIIGFIKNFSNFRYSAIPIANQDYFWLLIFYIFAKDFLVSLLFVLIFFNFRIKKFYFKLFKFLITVSLFFLITGVGDAFMFMVSLFFLLYTNTFRKLMFERIKPFFFFASVIILYLGFTIGIATKHETDISFINLNYDFLLYAFDRTSINWYSLKASLYYNVESSSNLQNYILSEIYNNFLYRLYLLTDLITAEKPAESSLAVINYKLMTLDISNTRSGTSPGLLASFIYVTPKFFVFFILIFYLIFYHFLLKFVKYRFFSNKLTLLGEFMIFYFFTTSLLQNPIDFLQIFDNSLIFLFTILFFSCLKKKIMINKVYKFRGNRGYS